MIISLSHRQLGFRKLVLPAVAVVVCLPLLAFTAGCGGSGSNSGSNGDSAAAPAGQPAGGTSDQTSNQTAANPAADTVASPMSTAPGTIQLPANFDPSTVPPPGIDTLTPASKDRGLQLPPLDGAAAGPTGHAATATQYHLTAALADDEVKVDLQAVSWEEAQAKVTKTGKLTVVDVWSLACEPCLKEFPGLVKIDRELGKSVACFALNSDFDGRRTRPSESYRQRVEAFLQSVQATFPNFLSTTASDDLFSELEIESIPAVLIYDADGKLIRKFIDAGADAGFTYEDHILPFIKAQLAK